MNTVWYSLLHFDLDKRQALADVVARVLEVQPPATGQKTQWLGIAYDGTLETAELIGGGSTACMDFSAFCHHAVKTKRKPERKPTAWLCVAEFDELGRHVFIQSINALIPGQRLPETNIVKWIGWDGDHLYYYADDEPHLAESDNVVADALAFRENVSNGIKAKRANPARKELAESLAKLILLAAFPNR